VNASFCHVSSHKITWDSEQICQAFSSYCVQAHYEPHTVCAWKLEFFHCIWWMHPLHTFQWLQACTTLSVFCLHSFIEFLLVLSIVQWIIIEVHIEYGKKKDLFK
jgi:hypothetical protein